MRKTIRLCLACVPCLGLAAGVVAVGEAKSEPAPNRAATRTYLSARRKLLDNEATLGDKARTDAGDALVAEIQRDCNHVLAGAPEDGPAEVLREEAVADLEYARLLTLRPAYMTFASVVGRLHWSSTALTTDVHREATLKRAMFSTAQPNICENAKEFVSSQYETAPAAARRFLAERRAIEVGSETRGPAGKPITLTQAITELLAPYARPSERARALPRPPTRANEESFARGLTEVLAALGIR